jgi:hypothetical protein
MVHGWQGDVVAAWCRAMVLTGRAQTSPGLPDPA